MKVSLVFVLSFIYDQISMILQTVTDPSLQIVYLFRHLFRYINSDLFTQIFSKCGDFILPEFFVERKQSLHVRGAAQTYQIETFRDIQRV